MVLGLIYLAVIGFCTYGAHVLMVGHAAQDFAGRKAAASAAGFIDGFGYIGAAMTGIFTGWLVDNYSGPPASGTGSSRPWWPLSSCWPSGGCPS